MAEQSHDSSLGLVDLDEEFEQELMRQTSNDVISSCDSDFEPMSRSRANTWHGVHIMEPMHLSEMHNAEIALAASTGTQSASKESLTSLKKATSGRRNAWGNMSYADLITHAIESSPDKRLTLAQIYDWMTKNVPYFCERSDAGNSGGWKNSIRHNLSLHNRFRRLPNEGGGKSSYWVINYDAMPQNKTPRRRALTMDSKTYDKKRLSVAKRHARGSLDLNPSAALLHSACGSSASSVHRLSPIEPINERDEMLSTTGGDGGLAFDWEAGSPSCWEGFVDSLGDGLTEVDCDRLVGTDMEIDAPICPPVGGTSSNTGTGAAERSVGSGLYPSQGNEFKSIGTSSSIAGVDGKVADGSAGTSHGWDKDTKVCSAVSTGITGLVSKEMMFESSENKKQDGSCPPAGPSSNDQSQPDLPNNSNGKAQRTGLSNEQFNNIMQLLIKQQQLEEQKKAAAAAKQQQQPQQITQLLQQLAIRQQQRQQLEVQQKQADEQKQVLQQLQQHQKLLQQSTSLGGNEYLKLITLPEFWSCGNPLLLAKVRELLLQKKASMMAANRDKPAAVSRSDSMPSSGGHESVEIKQESAAVQSRNNSFDRSSFDTKALCSDGSVDKRRDSLDVGSSCDLDSADIRFDDVEHVIRQDLGYDSSILDFNFDLSGQVLLCDDDDVAIN